MLIEAADSFGQDRECVGPYFVIDIEDLDALAGVRVMNLQGDNICGGVRDAPGARVDPFVDIKADPRGSVVEVG